MVKKMSSFIVVLLALGMLTFPAGAWVFVPDYGDTGWQHYTYKAGPRGFTGFAGFVVSNQGDTLVDSTLLVDNLSHCLQPDNKGFELGNYLGYIGYFLTPTAYLNPGDTGSFGFITTGPVIALSGNVYNPTEGLFMSQQLSFNADTSRFDNFFDEDGTNGSILETFISLAPGETFSFDWAFLTNNHLPFKDFSKFFLMDCRGRICFEDGLGQVVPLPPAVLLLGSGLLGIGGFNWRRKKLAAGNS